MISLNLGEIFGRTFNFWGGIGRRSNYSIYNTISGSLLLSLCFPLWAVSSHRYCYWVLSYSCLNETIYLLKSYLWKGNRVRWPSLKLSFCLPILKTFPTIILFPLDWIAISFGALGLASLAAEGFISQVSWFSI